MVADGLSVEEMVLAARETLRPTPCAVLPWFTEDELREVFGRPGGVEAVMKFYRERELRIFLASDGDGVSAEGHKPDPYRYGFELGHWADADADLKKAGWGQYNAGGKRATKSERAAKRVVQAAMNLRRSRIWCMQGVERTSITEQQSLIWKYLPVELKALNGRARTGWAKINYSTDGGFASRILVLPNRSEIHFLTYNQDFKKFQGWELGAVVRETEEKLMRENGWLHNLGAWMDEDAPLEWVKTVMLRCASRNASWLWTFSTMEGITPAIKEVIGTGEVLQTRRAELLAANRVHVVGCPAGHMPYIQRGATPDVSVIYFHTDLNPFPPNYENVKAFCAGKPDVAIMQDAYGYSTDTRNRAFPKFGAWNVVPAAAVPERGTNYMLTDPAGARNWATIWVRVAPGNPATLYVYRDWPDEATYGAWAEPSRDPNQPDGDPGPAQKNLGLGIEALKSVWLGLEKGEVIEDRLIDPRAGRTPHIEREGGTCLVDELAKGDRPMYFRPANGSEKHVGLSHLDELLCWDRGKPLVPLLNAPHLYVSDACQQVIWTLSNYTDRGGERGGCKDFADLLRYMALADFEYHDPGRVVSWSPDCGY